LRKMSTSTWYDARGRVGSRFGLGVGVGVGELLEEDEHEHLVRC